MPAYDSDSKVRDGAWVADITGLLDVGGWPTGMRGPHAEKQLCASAQVTASQVRKTEVNQCDWTNEGRVQPGRCGMGYLLSRVVS
jgi:hypothetical protein